MQKSPFLRKFKEPIVYDIPSVFLRLYQAAVELIEKRRLISSGLAG